MQEQFFTVMQTKIFLYEFMEVTDYADKEYGVYLEWAYFTKDRAKLILKYIKEVLSPQVL